MGFTAAGVLGGAVIGAIGSELSGGNTGRGALIGAVGGGLGWYYGWGGGAAGAGAGAEGVAGSLGAAEGFGLAASDFAFQSALASGGTAAAGGFGGLTAGQGLILANTAYGLNEARKVRSRMDPFRGQRAEYGRRLAELEANPELISSQPGYQAGLQAVQRRSAAGGYLGSGNEVAALARYGGDFYSRELNRLASLAGAGVAPGAGEVPAAMLTGQVLAGLGYGFNDYGGRRLYR